MPLIEGDSATIPKDFATLSATTTISLTLLSFGGHLARSTLPVLEVFFLEDGFVTSSGYGLLLAAQSFPALILPFFIGYLYDTFDYRHVTVCLLVTALMGQVLFALAVTVKSLPWAIAAQLIFGSGVSGVMVAQRALISENLKGREGLGTGCTVAVASIAKLIGKASMAPIVIWLRSYKLALFCFCLYSLFSLVAGLVAMYSTKYSISAHVALPLSDPDEEPAPKRSLCDSLSLMSSRFYCVVFTHMTYLLVFHLLGNFLPHILTVSWNQGIVVAGFIASLSSLFPMLIAPVVGYTVDRFGFRIEICILAGVATTVAYALFLFSSVVPVLPILLISVAQSLIPTITLAMVPLCIPSVVFGIGFGIVEFVDHLGNLVGNFGFGYLYQATSSYKLGMILLFLLSILGLLLLSILTVIDRNSDFRRKESFRYLYDEVL